MNHESDWKERKEKAVAMAVAWVDDWQLKKFIEPTREGRRRGEVIGFSKRKRRAADLMILHNELGLLEISRLAGVSPGFYRRWRVERAFTDVGKEACGDLGTHIMGTIAREFGEDSESVPYLETHGVGLYPYIYWIRSLPFFHPLVFSKVMELLTKKIESKQFRYIALLSLVLESISFFYEGSPKKMGLGLINNPALVRAVKLAANISISILGDRSLRTDQEATIIANELRKVIFGYVDLLAGSGVDQAVPPRQNLQG